MWDLDNLIDKSLKNDYPVLYQIMVYKIDGLTNKEIAEKIQQDYDTTYSAVYLSTLWHKKIPKIISDYAKKDWIEWHYLEEEKGTWKKCSRCKTVKLAHPYFFTRNNTAKDHWYSLCKVCRNKKKAGGA